MRALVTGASSGIGSGFAVALAERGVDLVITARRLDRLEALAGELRARCGTNVECVSCDLLLDEDIEKLSSVATQGQRPIDLLINNAGFGMNRRFLSCDLERMDKLLRLDLRAPVRICRDFGASMSDRGRGGIINVASTASFIPTPHHAVYSATKAALLIFSEGFALELAPSGVTVTTLCPGVTDTEFFDAGDYETKSPIYTMKRMSAASVVKSALSRTERGGGTVVPGVANRMLLTLNRMLPRAFVTGLAGRAMSTD